MSRHTRIGLGLAAVVLLSFATAIPGSRAAEAEDVMISSYVEGTANNKAIELYNPTGEAITLSDYSLKLFSNGAVTPTNSLDLSDQVLPPNGYLLITHAQAGAELAAKGQLTSAVVNFNGDDALVLYKAAAVVDSIGQVGFDPGNAWSASGVSTRDATLTKKACTVDLDPNDSFDPAAEFTASAIDDFSTLGSFSCSGLPPTPQPSLLPIGSVQGDGAASPMVNDVVEIRGVVVGDFQEPGELGGYFVQDGGDSDPATSDGIFVYDTANQVSPGDPVRISGKVSEYRGQTQITPTSVTPEAGLAIPDPTALHLPVGDWERYEAMSVEFPQSLSILEYHNFDRYGEIVYGTSRQWTPTAVTAPGGPALGVLAENQANRLIVDDGRNLQNPTPAIHPNGSAVAKHNYFRGGDMVTNLSGVLSQSANAYRLQPTKGADYASINPRPAAPAKQGDLRIASFNVLNYFTTLTSENPDARGADTPEEFSRQQAKIVAALHELDADVLGLMEIENNGTAVENLVAALNARAGAGTYAAVNTGVLGSDAIIQAFIYKPAVVELAGSFAALDFADGKNRHALTQTFKHRLSGELVTVSVNHLKSKGSACDGDPDLGDGQGNCNLTRTSAAKRLAEWLATDPTGQGAARVIIIGDLNSYDHEDPIAALTAAGYTDMEQQFGGEYAYSYVFDGMLGYLDHALANAAARADIVNTQAWHINADESDLFDYDLSYKKPAEQDLFSPDPYRSSDHDPVVVDLQFASKPPVVEPTAEASPSPTAPPTSAGTTEVPKPRATTTKPGLPATGQDRLP